MRSKTSLHSCRSVPLVRRLPSSVPFASLLVYSPRGESKVSKSSKDICLSIKAGRPESVTQAVTRLAQVWQTEHMDDFFGPDVILVPAPKSSPLVPGALWPAEVLCREMVKQGLAKAIQPALKRITRVTKSAGAKERPDIHKHMETMEAVPWLSDGGSPRVTIVDDVITKGATLYAGCVLIREAMPDADVRVFALVRTMSYGDVEKILVPAVGVVKTAWDN